jgi:hypothetical protein
MRQLAKIFILCLLLGLFFTSCASGPVKWAKAGVTDSQLKQDMAECDKIATLKAGQDSGLIDPAIYQFDATKKRTQLFDECMPAKGYTKLKE